MAGECQGRPAGKLSLLVGLAESFSSPASGECFSGSPTARSPRSFDYDGAVGLGIVAAIARTPKPVVPPRRSEPIPIVSARREASGIRRNKQWEQDDEEDMELSESYTCVISHVAGAAVSKRVYFDDGTGDFWGCCPGVFFESPPPPPRAAFLPDAAADFLSRCFRCGKNLHGLDIFMYRGDRAFCSEECRCQQMMSDEHREKCMPDALKPFDCSVSPCSTPLLFAAGVAAA